MSSDASQADLLWGIRQSAPEGARNYLCEKLVVPVGDAVISVAFSGSGQLLIAGAVNKAIKVFSTASGEEYASYTARASVTAVAVLEKLESEDRWCLVGTFAGWLQLFALTTNRVPVPSGDAVLETQFGHGDVSGVAVSADSSRVVAGGSLGVVVKYHFEPPAAEDGPPTLSPLLTIQSTVGPVLALALDASGGLLATGGEDKKLKLWSICEAAAPGGAPQPPIIAGMPPTINSPTFVDETEQRLMTIFLIDSPVHSVALDAPGATLAVGASSHTEVYRLAWRLDPTHAPAVGPKGSVGVQHEPVLYLEDAAALQGGVALSADGATLTVGGKHLVHVIDVPSGSSIRRLPQVGRVRCAAVSPDGAMAASAGFDKKARLLRIDHGTRMLTCTTTERLQYRSIERAAPPSGSSKRMLSYEPQQRQKSAKKPTASPEATKRKLRNASVINLTKATEKEKAREDAAVHSFVRSVHMVKGVALMAIGMDEGSRGGSARIYDTNEDKGDGEARKVHTWRTAKAVWAVRLTSDGGLLFAAGYDCSVTLYDVESKARLLSLVHSAAQGPAFIWSLSLSADDRLLAVGCWSGIAHCYAVNIARLRWRTSVERLRANQGKPPLVTSGKVGWDQLTGGIFARGAKGGRPPTPLLAEVAAVERSDRVYAVALSRGGSHLAVAGRDKTVSLFELRLLPANAAAAYFQTSSSLLASASSMTARSSSNVNGGSSTSSSSLPASGVSKASSPTAACLWTITTEDYVYCVALSSSMQYCVYGGPEMVVHVLDGKTGLELWSIPCAGTVWSMGILDDGSSSHSHTSGGGGSSSSSSSKLVIGGDFHEVSVHDLSSRRCELKLLQQQVVHGVAITDDSVGFSSGSHAYAYGQAGTHYSWRERPSFAHVVRMMSIASSDAESASFLTIMLEQHPALANARDPMTGESLIQEIVESGYGDYSALLDRVLHAKCEIGLRPDFHGLHPLSVAISHGKLNPLRALLKAVRTKRVSPTPLCMSLVSRSFAGIAATFPSEFLDFIKDMRMEEEPEVLYSTGIGADLLDVPLSSLLTKGSDQRCPKGIWAKALLECRSSNEQALEQGRRSSADAAPDPFSAKQRNSALLKHTQEVRRTLLAAAGLAAGGGGGSGEDSKAEAVEGFPRGSRGALRAMCIPIENFAGRLECEGGVRTTVLELCVDAVTITRDYSVFGTTSLQILLDFKWNGYARKSFLRKLVFFFAHLLWSTSFTLEASKILDERLSPSQLNPRQHWFLLLGWVQTTVVSLIYLRASLLQARAWGLVRYVQDGPEMNNLLYNGMQVVVNVLFWLREVTPDFVFSPGGRANLTVELADASLEPDLDENGMIEWGNLREKERYDRLTKADRPLGLYITLQSWVMVLLFMRMLFFFRGFRSFAALFNITVETAKVVMPMIVLVMVITSGFGFGTHLLLQHTVFGLDPNYLDPIQTLNTVWNAGFRFIPPKPEPFRSRWQISIMYVLFMAIVNMLLLNLLVAMMAGTFTRLRANAQLMAEYERAKLILQLEQHRKEGHDEHDQHHGYHHAGDAGGGGWSYTAASAWAVLQEYVPKRATPIVSSASVPSRASRIFLDGYRKASLTGARPGGGAAQAGEPVSQQKRPASPVRAPPRRRRRTNREKMFPKWLHVLMPADSGKADDDKGKEDGKDAKEDERLQQKREIADLNKKLGRMEAMLATLLEQKSV